MSQVVLLVHSEELNGVLGALAKLPYEASAGMIHKLQAQAGSQSEVRAIVAGLPPLTDEPKTGPQSPVAEVVKPRRARRAEARAVTKSTSKAGNMRPPLAKAPEQVAAT